MGSITLAVNGVPVFVDPGSYLYTPSAVWRNDFRSIHAHNSVSLDGQEPVVLSNDYLFQLPLEESYDNAFLQSSHTLYGHTLERKVVCNKEDMNLKIIDTFLTDPSYTLPKTMAWNFTLGTTIQAQQEDEHTWVLYYEQKPLVKLVNKKLTFTLKKRWTSPAYGVKQQTTCLQSEISSFSSSIETVLYYFP